MTPELDLEQLEAPQALPVLGKWVPPTTPIAGAIFKDTALAEQCVAETIRTVSVAEAR